MSRILLVIASFVTPVVSFGEPAAEELVRDCIDQLATKNSHLVADGRLSDEWSSATTMHYESSGIWFVTISRSDHSSHDHAVIDERPSINCTFDANRLVVYVDAPETEKSGQITRLFSLGAVTEDEIYQNLVSSFHGSDEIRRVDSTLRISGTEVKAVGSPTTVKVKRSAFD